MSRFDISRVHSFVGWAKARSAVPSRSGRTDVTVGTLRFAHPTDLT
jgi:hypothetical protein